MSSDPESIFEKPRGRCRPFVGHKSRGFGWWRKDSLVSSGICHVIQCGPAEFTSTHNFSSPLGHIFKQNGTLVCLVSCFTSCREDAPPSVSSEGEWSTYHSNNNAIVMPIMHSAEGCEGWFTPAMHLVWIEVGLRSRHKRIAPEFVCM